MFAMPEVKRGLTPVPGLFTLPRLIGQSNSMLLLLSGEPIDAKEAYRIGLVTRVVPIAELMPTAISMAETICGNSPLGVRATKQVVKLGAEGTAKPGYCDSLFRHIPITGNAQIIAYASRSHAD